MGDLRIASLAMAYHFHVRKNKGLSLAGIIEAITGFKAHGPVGRIIDQIFLFATFGGAGPDHHPHRVDRG